MENRDDGRLLDFHELARRGLPRSTAYRLINEGTLVAVKVGRRTKVRLSDFERYLSSLPMVETRPAA